MGRRAAASANLPDARHYRSDGAARRPYQSAANHELSENSPALERWITIRKMRQVPSGTTGASRAVSPSFVPAGTSACSARGFPSAEAPGYFRNASGRDATLWRPNDQRPTRTSRRSLPRQVVRWRTRRPDPFAANMKSPKIAHRFRWVAIRQWATVPPGTAEASQLLGAPFVPNGTSAFVWWGYPSAKALGYFQDRFDRLAARPRSIDRSFGRDAALRRPNDQRGTRPHGAGRRSSPWRVCPMANAPSLPLRLRT